MELLRELTEAGTGLTSAPDLLVDAVRRLCAAGGWRFGRAWLVAADGSPSAPEACAWHASAPASDGGLRAGLDASLVVDDSLLARALATGSVGWIADASTAGGCALAATLASAGVRGAVAVPLRTRGAAVGVLAFLAHEPLAADASLLAALACIGAELGAQVQRRRAGESALVEWMAIVEASIDAVCTFTPDGAVTYLNEAGRRLVGVDDAAARAGLSLDDLYPAWAAALMTRAAIPAAQRHGRWQGMVALRRADGTEAPVQQVVVAHTGHGGAQRFSAIIRDAGQEPHDHRLDQSETERLGRIIDIQQAIATTTSMDMEQVVQSVLEGAQALTRAEGVGVVMRDGINFPLRGATDTGPARAGVPVSPDRPSLTGECVRTGRVLRCDDTETDPRVDRASSRASGTRSMLYMPVHDGTDVIGLVAMLASRPAAFTDRDEQSLTLVSGLLSAAMARAAAFETNQTLLAERTATLAALRESEERYRSVTEQICEVLFETDSDGRLSFLSAAWPMMTGFSVDETVGTDLVHLVCEEDRAAMLRALRPLILGQRPQCDESIRYRTRDGSIRWLELRARLRTDTAGRILGTTGTLNDITERVEAEQSVRLQALTFATINDAVIVTGPDGKVLDWNPAAERIFGYARDEMVGERPTRLGASAAEERLLDGTLASAERWAGEMRCRRKDGTERICESVFVPLLDALGALVCTVGVSRDVTDRKLLEQKLLQAQKLEAIGQLAAGIAHEINTPTQYVGDNVRFVEQGVGDVFDALTSLQRLADACRAAELFPAEVAAVDTAAAHADLEFLATELPAAIHHSLEGMERIAEIVRGMKAFSHPGSGGLTPVDLNHQLESTLTVSRSEWTFAADVVRDLDPALPLVHCRVGEINQVLLNVVVNAAQAIADAQRVGGRSRGHIRVHSRVDGAWVEIRIGDTGTGIPEAARPRIFDPFFTTKEVGRGTGQGLSIAHGVVEKHGGSITFETELGVGTTFIIRLPIMGPTGLTAGERAA